MYPDYWQELEQLVEKFHIERNNICIAGSSVLAFAGIWKNRDIDFAMHPFMRKMFLEKYRDKVEVLKSGTINMAPHVQVLQNRYAKIGLLDEELFDGQYSIKRDGYWIVKPELEIAQKIERSLEKDRNLLKTIGNSFYDIEGFDKELFEKLTNKKRAVIFGAGMNAKLAYYCYSAKYELVCYIDNNAGLWGTELNGLKVYSPDILKDIDDAVIIISNNRYEDEMKKEILLQFGKRKVITFCMEEKLSILGE